MRWRGGLLVGTLALAGVVSACNCCNSAKENDVENYVNNKLNPYLQHLSGAVCQLERNAGSQPSAKLTDDKLQCPPGGPGDGTPPPKYPPK